MEAMDTRAVTSSLCAKIAGTINPTDFERFEELYRDAAVAELLPKTACVRTALGHLLSQPMVSGEDLLKKASALKREPTTVVQLVPDGYGYILKWADAPKDTKPKEKKVSKDQAKQALPQKMLDTADEQGAATMTEVEAEPDPLVETPQPVQGFGMYKVYEAGTGRQLVGYVIPGLFDPVQGTNSPMSLWTSGGKFALQPEINGVMVALSYNLPESLDARGMGIFYKTDGRSIIATVPYNVMTRVRVEGREYFAATTMEGQEVQLVMSEGLMKPVATSPQEIAIPADFSFLALDEQTELDGGVSDVSGQAAQDPMQKTKAAMVHTMCEIRAWRNEQGPGGGVRLSGPVFEKNGSGTYDWVDGIFWLAAAGMPQNMSLACIDKAASTGDVVRMYGLQPLDPSSTGDLKEATAAAVADLAGLRLPERHCLLKEAIAIGHNKEARTLVGVDAVDNLLALNFLNPENVQSFVEQLPQLEETASKLASLVFATQVGLQSVSQTAAVRAMECLEDVITGLKALQNYRL